MEYYVKIVSDLAGSPLTGDESSFQNISSLEMHTQLEKLNLHCETQYKLL